MALEVTTTRVIGEVLYLADSLPEDLRVKTSRVAVEVLGTAADFLGKRAHSTRFVAEVVGRATAKHPGLLLPSIPTAGITVAACIDFRTSTYPGYIGLLDANGHGLSWEWSDSSGSVTQRYRLPGLPDEVSTVSGSPVVTVFSSANGSLILSDLAVMRPAGSVGGAVIKELLVFGEPVTPEYAAHLEAYLLCRWSGTGCTSPRSPCPQ